jgi:hypothetical protein
MIKQKTVYAVMEVGTGRLSTRTGGGKFYMQKAAAMHKAESQNKYWSHRANPRTYVVMKSELKWEVL